MDAFDTEEIAARDYPPDLQLHSTQQTANSDVTLTLLLDQFITATKTNVIFLHSLLLFHGAFFVYRLNLNEYSLDFSLQVILHRYFFQTLRFNFPHHPTPTFNI